MNLDLEPRVMSGLQWPGDPQVLLKKEMGLIHFELMKVSSSWQAVNTEEGGQASGKGCGQVHKNRQTLSSACTSLGM